MKQLLITLCCLLITACGFHLRRPAKLPQKMRVIYLNTENPYSSLSRYLKRALTASGVKLAQSPDKAHVILSVSDDKTSVHQIGVGANQQTRAFEVISSLTYRLTTPRGKIITRKTVIRTTRQITLMPNEELFNTNKLDNTRTAIQNDLIEQLLYRLYSRKV